MVSTAKQRKITITGASGVGKTTLASRLSAQLNLPLIEEVARKLCSDKGLSSPTEITDQQSFRQEVLQVQIESEKASTTFVADRGVIDCWVLFQRWQMCSAMTYDTEAYYERCAAQAQQYTHIIYVPPLIEPVDDAFRWTDKDYTKQIDRLTRLTLVDWSLLDRTYTIQSANLDERVSEVLHWLD